MKKILLIILLFSSCQYRYEVEIFSANSDMYEVIERQGIVATQRQLAYGVDDVKHTIQKMKEARRIIDSINQ